MNPRKGGGLGVPSPKTWLLRNYPIPPLTLTHTFTSERLQDSSLGTQDQPKRKYLKVVKSWYEGMERGSTVNGTPDQPIMKFKVNNYIKNVKKTDIEGRWRIEITEISRLSWGWGEYVSQQLWPQVPHAASFCATWRCLYTDSKCLWTWIIQERKKELKASLSVVSRPKS